MRQTLKSPKTNKLSLRLNGNTLPMLDETASKTLHRAEVGD